MGEMRSNGMLRCEGVWVCGCVVVDTEEESGGWGEPDDECGDNELITLIVTETTDKLVSMRISLMDKRCRTKWIMKFDLVWDSGEINLLPLCLLLPNNQLMALVREESIDITSGSSLQIQRFKSIVNHVRATVDLRVVFSNLH